MSDTMFFRKIFIFYISTLLFSKNNFSRGEGAVVTVKLLRLFKLIILSTILFHAYLFADTYKLEVKKDKQTVKFCVHNLTYKYTDWFSVKKVGGSYESGDSSICGYIRDMKIGTGIGFNFGGFWASFDDKKNQLNLCGGYFADTLLLEKIDCPVVVASGTALQIGTLVTGRTSFKNEGTLEAFIAILRDRSTVENRGKFHARNLFLYGTDIQNYGIVMYDDAFKAVSGNIVPKAANSDFPEKKGFIQAGGPSGNTWVLPLHKTYHGKTVVREGSLQLKELTDGSLNVCDFWGKSYNYTAVLVGYLDACGGVVVDPGTTLNFYPGSCFVIREGSGPVVLGSGMKLNLGCSDDPSWDDCSLKNNTMNIKSGSVSPLGNSNGDLHGDSKEGVWISPFNGQTPLFPDFDTVRTYQARETKELTLYIIYDT